MMHTTEFPTETTVRVSHKFAKGDYIQAPHSQSVYEIGAVRYVGGKTRYELLYTDMGRVLSLDQPGRVFGTFDEWGDIDRYELYVPPEFEQLYVRPEFEVGDYVTDGDHGDAVWRVDAVAPTHVYDVTTIRLHNGQPSGHKLTYGGVPLVDKWKVDNPFPEPDVTYTITVRQFGGAVHTFCGALQDDIHKRFRGLIDNCGYNIERCDFTIENDVEPAYNITDHVVKPS